MLVGSRIMPLTLPGLNVTFCLDLKQKTPTATASSNTNRTVIKTATANIGKPEAAGLRLESVVFGVDSMSVNKSRIFVKIQYFD